MHWQIIEDDCVAAMAAMPDASVDAVVTDPPYDLTAGKRGGTGAASINLDSPYGRARIGTGNGAGGFMGKAWDGTGVAFDPATWVEALRVLKPGGYLLAFGGTRTYHRLTCAIEDAGFEVRDCLAWLYGSGFPKSLNLDGDRQGWGTALKPAHEPIVLARKPLTGTVAGNVLAHGTGALNVDGCRIWTDEDLNGGAYTEGREPRAMQPGGRGLVNAQPGEFQQPAGRWPANVVLDPEAAALLDEQTGDLHSQDPATRNSGRKPGWSPSGTDRPVLDKSNPNGGDSGGASRFFYVAKADSAERSLGLHGQRNPHPTVKPVALMRWLCRLVTPPGGIVLDPFVGSGTTGIAALREGFSFVGIEREAEYVAIARARIIGDAPLLNTHAEAARAHPLGGQ